jgi:hypothetical protein
MGASTDSSTCWPSCTQIWKTSGAGYPSRDRDCGVLFEALDALTPEERHRVYGMLGLEATITMDGTLEVSGTFNEGDALCGMKTQSSTP